MYYYPSRQLCELGDQTSHLLYSKSMPVERCDYTSQIHEGTHGTDGFPDLGAGEETVTSQKWHCGPWQPFGPIDGKKIVRISAAGQLFEARSGTKYGGEGWQGLLHFDISSAKLPSQKG